MGINCAWADPAAVGTTLFSENFSSYSKDDVPSGTVTTATGRAVYGDADVTYTCTASGTKIYNENTGGGTAPEILVAKNGGTFVIAGIPSGDAQAITVSWTQNKQSLDVAPTGTGYSGSVSGKPANAGTRSFDITVADGADATFTLTFTGSGTSNVRVDDILVTVKTAGEGGAPAPTLTAVTVSGAPTKISYYAGDNFDPAGLTVKGTYDDSSVKDITSGITWTYNPSQTLVKDQTSIGVIATVSEIASAEYNVTGLTVTAASPKITITQDEVASFTNTYAQYTWTAGGVSGKMYAYKNAGMQFNSSKTGYYVYNTDPIPGRITKITMTKASGTDRSWTPYVSTTAMTSASGTALDAQTVTSTGVSWDVTGSNSYFYLTVAGGSTVIGSIVIEYTEDAPPAIDAPSISGDVNFVGSTTVTISHDDADHIYYTTNGVDPTTSSTEYTAPFVVNADGTTTVKAIAVKGSDVSEVASKGFTKVTALESLAVLLEATTSSETAFNVVIDNWVVTGVNGNRAWIADAANENGILLYKSGHGFTAGKKLNGVVIGTKTKLFQGYPEMTTLVSTDVTVTTAETVSPRTTTIAALTSGYNAEQGTVVKLEGVTYSSSVLTDGENSIAADNKLFSSLALVDGTTYDITGVVEYENGGVVKIMPRSADDIEAQSAVVTPTAANLAALKAAERGTYILTLTNAVVTYVNGKNAFIEDATGGALIFIQDHGYTAGNCLNGDYQVTTTDYQGKFEITAIEPQAGATTTTADIPLTTVSIATLNASFSSYESRRVKIAAANVTDAISGSDRNGAINDGAALAVYAAVASTITLTADDNVDIIGYPGFHNTDQQLNVWRQEDITVNVKEDPELAYDPASETIEQGASWSAPTLTNPHSLTISSYASNNESVATVTGEGVIALAGGLGTAVITAHFNGDATYNAGNATYTITVEEADARKKATGSAFEAISGDLTPADITFAAYKGDGTTTPVINSSNIRLYKPASGKSTGSYLTVTAKVGCTIDQVKITFAGAATAAYSVDDAELPTEAFITGQTELLTAASLNAQSVSIVNLKNGSIDVSEIKVWYTGTPLAIDHYFLGGTYETTFEQNGTFDYTGLKVYAAYDAGETITEEITGFVVQADLTTAGNKKAVVMLNSVKIAEYDITVTAGKEDPALAYSPVSETITAGDAWSAPTLSNTFSVSPITYSSDKESVATVTSEGVITLAGGYGTAVITAHFDETAAYIESEATYTITVNKPAPTPTSTVYRKVTVTADITDGEYLIVYEGDATHDAAVFDGSLDNVDQAMKALAVEIVSDEIAGNTDLDAAVFTIDVTAGTLQSASGWYIGREANSNGMDKSTTEAYVNTFAITDGKAVITGSAGPTLRYNYASDQLRFRYYKTGQQAIQLYKKEGPAYTEVRNGLTPNHYYTICNPKAMTDVQGATLWSFVGKDANFAYLVQETATTIEAGKPYIMYATASTITAVLSGDDAAAGSNGALHGTFSLMEQAALNDLATAAGKDLYLVIGDELRRATGYDLDGITPLTGNRLPAQRAYVIVAEIPNSYTPMPGKKYRSMGLPKQTPTGIDNAEASDQPMKVMINGQLFILRGEKKYDATGRLVK